MKAITYLLIITLFFACTLKQEPQKNKALDKQKVTKEAEQMLKSYFDDMNSRGLLSEFKYLDTSDDFFWVPPGMNKHLTFDEAKTIIEANAEHMQNMNNEWQTLEIHPLSNEIATYTGVLKAKYTDPNDSTYTEHNYKLIESGVLIKRQDGWKILCGQSAEIPKE